MLQLLWMAVHQRWRESCKKCWLCKVAHTCNPSFELQQKDCLQFETKVGYIVRFRTPGLQTETLLKITREMDKNNIRNLRKSKITAKKREVEYWQQKGVNGSRGNLEVEGQLTQRTCTYKESWISHPNLIICECNRRHEKRGAVEVKAKHIRAGR